MLFLGAAVSLFDFWWVFYTEIFQTAMPVFKSEVIKSGYLEQRRLGFWLDIILAPMMLVASVTLWFRSHLKLTKVLAIGCSLSCLVLGGTYLFTGWQNEFYSSVELYASTSLTIDISLVSVGILGLIMPVHFMLARPIPGISK